MVTTKNNASSSLRNVLSAEIGIAHKVVLEDTQGQGDQAVEVRGAELSVTTAAVTQGYLLHDGDFVIKISANPDPVLIAGFGGH